MKKILAFTLAETLIVMGIIGIVSALTLPNLNSSTGEKEKIAKVKKIYQNVNDALGRAQAVYGPIDEWFVNDGTDFVKKGNRLGERISEFMKVSKTCGYGDGESNMACFKNVTVESSSMATTITGYKFILADGTAMSIYYNNSSIVIMFDIDGPTKGVGKKNKDVFLFEIKSDGTFASDYKGNFSDDIAVATQWIIRNDNMDYLKCLDKLNWETKTSCK